MVEIVDPEKGKKEIRLDKDELKRLSPAERIKRLKEIEEQRKKEKEESEKLIKESFEEIEREQRLKEVPVPEAEPVDISKLFEASDLGEQIRDEEAGLPPEEAERQRDYGAPIQEEVETAYEQLRELTQSNDVGYGGMQQAAESYNRIMEAAYESQSESMKSIAQSSRRMMEELFGEDRDRPWYL